MTDHAYHRFENRTSNDFGADRSLGRAARRTAISGCVPCPVVWTIFESSLTVPVRTRSQRFYVFLDVVDDVRHCFEPVRPLEQFHRDGLTEVGTLVKQTGEWI